MNQYLAVTSNGLENLLVEELTQLGINDAKPVQAGVKFKATNEQIYRCCLWSRLASRFVRIVAEFKCQNDLDLYLSTTSVNWVNYFHSSKKLVVDFNGTNREIRNSQYGAMKVKDAIVDCFTKKIFRVRRSAKILRIFISMSAYTKRMLCLVSIWWVQACMLGATELKQVKRHYVKH